MNKHHDIGKIQFHGDFIEIAIARSACETSLKFFYFVAANPQKLDPQRFQAEAGF